MNSTNSINTTNPTNPKDILSIDGSLKPSVKETVIIDNASADGTGDMVHNEFPWTAYVRNDKNMGFAASANQGINQSTGEYVLLLNSDTVLLEGEIVKMLEFMEKNDDVGICGPQLVYPDMRPQRSFASIPSLLTEILPFRRKQSAVRGQGSGVRDQRPEAGGRRSEVSRQQTEDRGQRSVSNTDNRSSNIDHRALAPRASYLDSPLSALDVPSLIGAAIMIRRSLFQELSGFDEQFFFFLEETDLCVRTQQRSGISDQQTADKGQGSEVRGQRSEVRGQQTVGDVSCGSHCEPAGRGGLSLRAQCGNLINRIATASPRDDTKDETPHLTPNALSLTPNALLLTPYRVVLLPDVKVIHLQGRTVGKSWVKGRIEYNISLYKFIKKHHSALYYRSFQAVRFLKSIITILVLSLLPFLLMGKGIRRRYVYYWKVLIWHLASCPPTAGLRPAA